MKAFALVHVGGKYLTIIENLPRGHGEQYLDKVENKVSQCVEENIPVYPLLPKTKQGEKELPDRIKKYPLNMILASSFPLQYHVAMARLLYDGVTFAEIGGVLRNGCVAEFTWVLNGSERDDDLLEKCLRELGYDTSKIHGRLTLPYKILEGLCL